jgi:predicted  nucleic acid-binding Zn-ribbon protein
MFADIRTEWRVNDIERSLHQKVDRHEISSLSRDVDRLERTLREACADIAWLRGELQASQEKVTQLIDAQQSGEGAGS